MVRNFDTGIARKSAVNLRSAGLVRKWQQSFKTQGALGSAAWFYVTGSIKKNKVCFEGKVSRRAGYSG